MEKVENVVKPPRKPVPRTVRVSSENRSDPISSPSANEPAMLIAHVVHRSEVPDSGTESP
jgi:hypothetical protein